MSTTKFDADVNSENPVIINNNDSNENTEDNYSSDGNTTNYDNEKRDNNEELEEQLEEDFDEELGEDLDEDLDEQLDEDLDEDLEEDLDEDLEEDLDEDLEEDLKLSDDTEIYVLCKNYTPVCYFGTKNLATEMMWKLARQNKLKFMDNFNLFIKENAEDSIDIVGCHKFLVFSYERVFATFTILPVKSLKTTIDEPKEDNNELKTTVDTTVDTTRSRWWG